MPLDYVTQRPWTRKHDDPRIALIPKAPKIVYPKSLAEIIELCRTRPAGERLKAAGSHWALSSAAISDHTFIETHDPNNDYQALGRTLDEVIPGCMTDQFLTALAQQGLGADPPPQSFVHVEAGKRIYQLYSELDTPSNPPSDSSLAGHLKKNHNNGSYVRSWAFETLGGAGGQTVVGAFSTGTHGGDFTLPPIADSVVALHLVADGGKHYWLERHVRETHSDVPMVDDKKLMQLYDTVELGGPNNFEIIRDSTVFNAVLVNVGRFGIIYSVVLRAVPQYMLHERRRLHVWQDFKHQIKDLSGPLYSEPAVPSANCRFLQVAISLTPHFGFQRNLAGITKRWPVVLTADPPGRKERVGAMSAVIDQQIQAYRFEYAGRTHGYSPDPDNPHKAAEPSLLEIACADASFMQGVLKAVIAEIEDFIASNGAAIGVGIGVVAAVGGAGLLALIPALALILLLLKKILDELDGDDRFGEFMEGVKNTLLNPNEKDPAKRAAGLFAWQLLVYKAFESQQEDLDFDAISYAMMDRKDYLNISCEVNVDSVEVFFDAVDDRLIAFVDALIAYEIMQEFKGLAFAGYASLRFMRPSRALIGMQKHHVTCSVEVACLRDVSGGQQLVNYAVSLARNPNINGLLHWGQHNDYSMSDVEHRYGDAVGSPGGALGAWRNALSRLTANGRLDGFSSDFTRQTGLEVVQPRLQTFNVNRSAASVGETVTLNWNCADNPHASRLTILINRPDGTSDVISGLALAGKHQIHVAAAGIHVVNGYLSFALNGVSRQASRTTTFTAS